MNPNSRAAALLFLSLLLPVTAFADEETASTDSLRLYNIREVVVTATRIPQELIQIPQRVVVLPMFRYRMNPALSVYDVLSQVSGVTLNRNLAVFSKKSVVSIRGMGNEQGRTLILIDGVPANKASTGGINLSRINPQQIERSEIVKGPGSSLYGGSAMGGTLNLISRRYDSALEGEAFTLWGERGTFGTNLALGGSGKRVYYSVNGYYLRSNGYNSTPKTERDETTIASSLDLYNIEGKMGIYLTPDHTLEGTASYYDGIRGNGTRFFFTEPSKGEKDLKNEVKEQNYRIRYQGKKEDKVWHVSGFYNQSDYTEGRVKKSTLYQVKSVSRDWGSWANLHFEPGDRNLMAMGIEVKGGAVNGCDHYQQTNERLINRAKSFLTGCWLEDEIRLERVKIIPSLRFDLAHVYDGGFFVENPASQTEVYAPYAKALKSEWWVAISPKLSLQYLFNTDNRLFLNSGLGFRAPTLEDMTRMGPVNGGVITPNPDLKPEHIFTTELGGDLHLWNFLTLTSSVYYTYGTDFIYTHNTGETLLMGKKEQPLLQKRNAGKVDLWGIEGDAYFNISDQLNLYANYTRTIAKMRNEYKGKRLPYVPENKYSAGGNWLNRIISVNVAYVQYGRQFLDDKNTLQMAAYGTLDVKLWHLFANKVNVSLNANNLFNRQVIENGSLSPGRLIYGQVKISF